MQENGRISFCRFWPSPFALGPRRQGMATHIYPLNRAKTWFIGHIYEKKFSKIMPYAHFFFFDLAQNLCDIVA